jgi:hypothetical protein
MTNRSAEVDAAAAKGIPQADLAKPPQLHHARAFP